MTSVSQPHPWGSKSNSKFHSSHALVSIGVLGKAPQSTCTPSNRLKLSEQFKHHSNFQIIASKSAFNLDSVIRIFSSHCPLNLGLSLLVVRISKFSISSRISKQNFQILSFYPNFRISKQNFQILNFHPNLVPLQGLWGVTAQAHQRERLDGPFQ